MGAHTTAGRPRGSARRAALAAAGIGVLAVVALPGAAVATPTSVQDACAQDPAGYGPPGTCEIVADVVSECRGDLPVLRYAASVQGTDPQTIDVRWANPAGTDVVQTGLPLAGDVVWPGTVVDADGNVVVWPGWELQADGTLVRGGDHEWARSTVTVSFAAGPQVTVAVDYPPDPSCDGDDVRVLGTSTTAGSSGTAGTSAQMAATGFDGAALAAGAVGLVAVGGGLAAWAVRRRRQDSARV